MLILSLLLIYDIYNTGHNLAFKLYYILKQINYSLKLLNRYIFDKKKVSMLLFINIMKYI